MHEYKSLLLHGRCTNMYTREKLAKLLEGQGRFYHTSSTDVFKKSEL